MYQQGRIRISKGVFLQDLSMIWPGIHIGKKSGKQSALLDRFKMSLNLFNLGKSDLYQFCGLSSIKVIIIDTESKMG